MPASRLRTRAGGRPCGQLSGSSAEKAKGAARAGSLLLRVIHNQAVRPIDGALEKDHHPCSEWGSTLALLVPFVLLALSEARTRLRQGLLSALLVAAVVAVLATVNRGVWPALMLAAVYVAVRFALAARLRQVAYVGAFVAVAISVLSGFGAGAGSRVQADNSTHDRSVLYEEATRKAASSPLLGYGAPSHSAPDRLPAVGTHGQFFLLLLSQGIPGLLFFFAFFAYSALKFRGLDPPLVFWAHLGLLIFFVESLYYELLPLQLILVMVLVGLAWRKVRHAGEPA